MNILEQNKEKINGVSHMAIASKMLFLQCKDSIRQTVNFTVSYDRPKTIMRSLNIKPKRKETVK